MFWLNEAGGREVENMGKEHPLLSLLLHLLVECIKVDVIYSFEGGGRENSVARTTSSGGRSAASIMENNETRCDEHLLSTY